MRQASHCVPVGRTRFCSANVQPEGQIGPAVLTAGNVLAVLCLLFGISFTTLVPASLGERIGSLFFFGLIPAAGFYAGGHILAYLLVLGSELCEMIAVRCFRCLVLVVNSFVSCISPPVSSLSVGCLTVFAHCAFSTLLVPGQKTHRPIRHYCWRAQAACIESMSLLIRSVARFVIGIRDCYARSVLVVRRGSWRLRRVAVEGMLLAAFALGWYGGNAIWPLGLGRDDPIGGVAVDAVVERIISIESNGDPNKKNKRSSATGLGQFLDETWLELIRTHR